MSDGKLSDEQVVTRLSFTLVISVFIIKCVISFLTNSFSFFTELTDATLDLIAVLITQYALRTSKKPADEEHMYGHAKINSMAGLIESVLILGIYSFIIYNAIKTLVQDTAYTTENGLFAAIGLMVCLSIVIVISQKIVKIGKKTKNKVIIAQGVNFRGDLYRNFSIIIGILVATYNLSIVDVIVALIFSFVSLYQGGKLLKECFNELLDANELAQATINKIRSDIRTIKNVEDIDLFADKTVGNEMDANLALRIPDKLSLEDLSSISNEVRSIFGTHCKTYNHNTMIQYNIDPKSSSLNLIEIIRKFLSKYQDKFNIHNIFIDYFSDEILVQFHIQVPPEWELAKAHEMVSVIEEGLLNNLKENPENSLIRERLKVLSHIEPKATAQKHHKHTKKIEIGENIEEKIKKISQKVAEIQKISQIDVYNETEGWDIKIVLELNPHLTIRDAHRIAERFEYHIRLEIADVFNCNIHTEPHFE